MLAKTANKPKSQFYGYNDTIFMTRHGRYSIAFSVCTSRCSSPTPTLGTQSNCLSKHKTLQMRAAKASLQKKEEEEDIYLYKK